MPQSGELINFVYVPTGSQTPTLDTNSLYFIESEKKLLVGNNLAMLGTDTTYDIASNAEIDAIFSL